MAVIEHHILEACMTFFDPVYNPDTRISRDEVEHEYSEYHLPEHLHTFPNQYAAHAGESQGCDSRLEAARRLQAAAVHGVGASAAQSHSNRSISKAELNMYLNSKPRAVAGKGGSYRFVGIRSRGWIRLDQAGGQRSHLSSST